MWQPHKALLHWTRGMSNPLSRCSHGLTRGMSNSLSGRAHGLTGSTYPPVWMSSPDPVANVSNKILDRVSQAIITHFTKNMLDRTFLGHFRRPATTCPKPPAEWKDKDDGKPSLQQSLTIACRIMMALSPSKHHHESQKVFPLFKGTKLLTL